MKKDWKKELLLLLVITLVVVTVGRIVVGVTHYTNYKYQYQNCFLLNKEYFAEYGEEYFMDACGLNRLDKWQKG